MTTNIWAYGIVFHLNYQTFSLNPFIASNLWISFTLYVRHP